MKEEIERILNTLLQFWGDEPRCRDTSSPKQVEVRFTTTFSIWVLSCDECYWGGGRIRDVASLIRRTDEPKIKKFFWGKKSK